MLSRTIAPATVLPLFIAAGCLQGQNEKAAVDAAVKLLGNAGVAATSIGSISVHDRAIGGISVAGARAIEAWEILRDAAGDTGRWPIIVGTPAAAESLAAHSEFASQTTRTVLREAKSIDLEAWFARRARSAPEVYEIVETAALDGDEWLRDPPVVADRLVAHRDVATMEPLEKVAILLVPCEESWRVPAILRFGGWNECPPPEVHTALLYHWSQRYGAEVVGVTPRSLELRCSRPPPDRFEAMGLAMLQFRYCPGIVHQGVGRIEALAAVLVGRESWYFWWD